MTVDMERDKIEKELVLFIHGLGGDSQATWGLFPTILQDDREIDARYQLAFFSYPTVLWRHFFSRRAPRIQELAAGLRTQINNRYADFKKIVLVCHSLGGLIARQYLLEEVKAKRSLRAADIVLFAVPNNGADLARIARLISLPNWQLRQLCKDADLIQLLNDDWFTLGLDKAVRATYIAGTQDKVVERSSALLRWGNPDVETVIGKGHRDIVKPVDANDESVVILKKILKQQGQRKDLPPATSEKPSVAIKGPSAAPLNRKTYYTILTQNAYRGEWSIGGFKNDPQLVDPLGPSHQIFIEPTDATRIGDSFLIAFTAYNRIGESITATKQISVVLPGPREPVTVTFADGAKGKVEFAGVIQAIKDKVPLLVESFGTLNQAESQIMDFLETKVRNELVKHTLSAAQSGREAIIANVIASARPDLEGRFMHRLHDIHLGEIRQTN